MTNVYHDTVHVDPTLIKLVVNPVHVNVQFLLLHYDVHYVLDVPQNTVVVTSTGARVVIRLTTIGRTSLHLPTSFRIFQRWTICISTKSGLNRKNAYQPAKTQGSENVEMRVVTR